MADRIVTDIQELVDCQKHMDDEAPAMEETVKAGHTTELHDFTWFIGRSIRAAGQALPENCHDCGSPEFNTLDSLTGTQSPWCRSCINVIRRKSLCHDRTPEALCFRCSIDYFPDGLIRAANHRTWPIEDFDIDLTGKEEWRAMVQAFNDDFSDFNSLTGESFDNWTDYSTFLNGVIAGGPTSNRALTIMQRKIDPALSISDWVPEALKVQDGIRIPATQLGLKSLITEGKVVCEETGLMNVTLNIARIK